MHTAPPASAAPEREQRVVPAAASPPTPGPLLGSTAARFLAVATALTAVYFALAPRSSVAASWIYNGASLGAAAGIALGVRRYRPANLAPWLCFAAGNLAFFAGDVLWLLMADADGAPFPSIADVAYLAGYPLLCLGMVLLVRGRFPGRDIGSLIDALILAAGAGVVTWVYLLQPIAVDRSLSVPELAVSMAYPLADLVLLGVGFRFVLSPGRRPTVFYVIAAALFAQFTADTIYGWMALNGSYGTWSPIDLGWLVAYAGWGVAALHPSMGELAEPVADDRCRLTNRRLVLMAAATLLAPILLVSKVTGATATTVTVLAVAAAGMSLLVIGRLVTLTRELADAALHDTLTGLPNRALLMEHLDHALARHDRSPADVAVLFVDLDKFKIINDTLGHAAGDELLVTVAQRLRRAVRAGDVVSRLGGDEFVVLCHDIEGADGAVRMARRIEERLSEPFWVKSSPLFVSASIGVALARGHEDRPEALVHDADMAMYQAKQRGKARHELAVR